MSIETGTDLLASRCYSDLPHSLAPACGSASRETGGLDLAHW